MVSKTPDDNQGGSPDQRLIREAKDRFTKVQQWEADSRAKFIADIKFCNGDADNLWQWPDSVRQSRGVGTRDERPCLTINKTHQHCLQIENDQRQNKTSITVHPTGNEATYEASEVLEGIIRHIQYISDAQSCYTTASRFQIQGGLGYWRVVTDYADEESLDQEIYIRRIRDPLTIMLDPDIQEFDGSDARYAFVFDDVPKDEFNAAYPKYKDRVPSAPLGATSDDWFNQDHVRVAEYFRAVPKDDKIAFMVGEDGKTTKVKASEMGEEMFHHAIEDPRTKWRSLVTTEIEWYLIVGDEIAERGIWPGKYIPIVRVIGEETIIEGKLDRKGHVRALKDPQRMYNFHGSAEVEFVALQSKIPYIGALKAIEELETYWETANTINSAFLPYNHIDDDGNPIPPPSRTQAPQASDAYLRGMATAANDMMLVSGQYQADMGAPSNEQSGKAIQQRQRQGENSTYHYIDNLATAIRFTGKIILDLVPKIYDTKRVIKIMAEDGEQSDVQIDPTAQQAYASQQIQNQMTAKEVIFNPAIGRYDVQVDVGPDYGTQREEAFNAISQILATDHEMWKVCGDLLFKSADFPLADELAERLERMVPPELKGEGPNPQVAQLSQENQSLQTMLQAMAERLKDKGEGEAAKMMDAQSRQFQVMTDSQREDFEALTNRLDVLFERLGAPADAASLERDALMAAHQSDLNMTEAEHGTALAMAQAEHAQSIAPEPQPAAAS
jgi:chaperonin cofactor prefoldin